MFRMHRLAPRLLALFIGIITLATAMLGPQRVYAGHTIANGDCWRGGPVMCRGNWTPPYSGVDIGVYDGTGNPALASALDRAMTAWNASIGPQWFQWNYPTYWVYAQADPYAPVGYGYTYNDDIYGNYMGLNPGVIGYSYVFQAAASAPYPDIAAHSWAHELGHTLGLYEHNDPPGDLALMAQGTYAAQGIPRDIDIGPWPPCSSPDARYRGIRCIYNWPY